MAWKLQAIGLPHEGDPVRWDGALSSEVLPSGVLACRAAILNLLADGASAGVRRWSVVGAITHPRTRRKPITVAYGDVLVPKSVAPQVVPEAFERRTIFDLLVRMKDPGQALAELEAIASYHTLGDDPVSVLLQSGQPATAIYEVLGRIV
jgi:hypothetical protein